MTTKEKIDDYTDRLLRHLAAARDYPEAHRNIEEPILEKPPEPVYEAWPWRDAHRERVKREFNRSF